MNNQQLKTYIKTTTNTLKNKLLKVIKEFPQGYDWNENHVDVAVNKLVEKPDLSTEQVINCIKRSYLCTGEKWFVDNEKSSEWCGEQLENGKCGFNDAPVLCKSYRTGGICLLNKA